MRKPALVLNLLFCKCHGYGAMSADRAADVKRDRVTVARDLCFQFSDIWYQFLSVSVLSLISVSFRRKRPKKMNPKKNTRESMIRTRKKKAAGSQRD